MSSTSRICRMMSDEKGAVSLEFTALVPFVIFLLVFFADAAVIYLTHTEMFNAARDIARRMSTEELETAQEVREYAASHLFLGQRRYVVAPEFGGEMSVALAVEVRDAAIFGAFFRPILGRVLLARATVRREPML